MLVANIIERERQTIDRKLGMFLFAVWFFFGVVVLLNVAGIFIVEQSAMTMVFCLSTVLLAVPFCMLTVLHIRGNAVRYLSSVVLNLVVGLLYTYFTFHTILMFVFPLLIVSYYGIRKLSWFTVFTTNAVIITSHFLSYFLNVIPEEPFKQLDKLLIYGMAPRLVEYCLFACVLMSLSKYNHDMIYKISKFSNDMFETQNELVKALAEISESKSGQTGQHIKRVSEYVNIMADKLGIKGDERQALAIAAMLHDIGKLNVPESILDKPGKLTPEEFEVIKKHTSDGFTLLENSPGRIMEIGRVIALEHHERWDGKGYIGKKGEEIDFYARIMAVCDVFDALVSKRSYKDGWPPEKAREEILSQSGRQFDPELVKVFDECYPDFCEIISCYPN